MNTAKILIIYLAVINVITFSAFAADKIKSQKNLFFFNKVLAFFDNLY